MYFFDYFFWCDLGSQDLKLTWDYYLFHLLLVIVVLTLPRIFGIKGSRYLTTNESLFCSFLWFFNLVVFFFNTKKCEKKMKIKTLQYFWFMFLLFRGTGIKSIGLIIVHVLKGLFICVTIYFCGVYVFVVYDIKKN